MKKPNRIFLAITTAVVCSFAASAAKANLILSGNLVGVFQPSANPNTSVKNSTDGDTSFRTGRAVSGSFQSGIDFTGGSFSDLLSGDELSLGMFTYYNGITKIGTSSGNAALDLYLELSDPESNRILLTTMTFGIDATTNTYGNLIADNYTVSFTQPSEVWIGGEWVSFSIGGLPSMISLAENTSKTVGSLTFKSELASPVAEGGTTALFLILGLGTIAACQSKLRRWAGGRSDSITAAWRLHLQ